MKTMIDKKTVQRRMIDQEIASFQELSKRAGISPTTLYNVFDNDNWTRKTLDSIAAALDVNPLTLLVVEDENEKRWDDLFADPRSEDVLQKMAAEARAAHRRGETKPLNLDDLK